MKRFRCLTLVFLVLSSALALGLGGCDAPEARHKAAGNLLFRDKKYAEAKASYEAAVKANPRDAGARILLGNTLFELGDVAGARREYEDALRLDPQASEAHRGLAI